MIPIIPHTGAISYHLQWDQTLAWATGCVCFSNVLSECAHVFIFTLSFLMRKMISSGDMTLAPRRRATSAAWWSCKEMDPGEKKKTKNFSSEEKASVSKITLKMFSFDVLPVNASRMNESQHLLFKILEGLDKKTTYFCEQHFHSHIGSP